MSYMLRNGWHCHFLEADLKTPLPRKPNFPSPGWSPEVFGLYLERPRDTLMYWSAMAVMGALDTAT